MKSTSTVGRSLQLLVLALCGLSFYALVLTLLVLIVGLAVSTGAHAQGSFLEPATAAIPAATAPSNSSCTNACAGRLTTKINRRHRSTQ
jgi:hypothetical protein